MSGEMRAMRGKRGVMVGVALSCCVLAAWVVSAGRQPSALLQEGIFTPAVQETIEPTARQQSLMAGYSAMGTVGGGEHGLHPVPPPPPPTWARGGHSWVMDGIYGNNQRPTTGIWANKGFGEANEGPPAADSGGVQEEDAVPTEEPTEPAGEPAAEEPAEDFAQPANEGEPDAEEEPAAAAEPEEEVVMEPNGQEEEVEEEPAEEPAEEAPAPAGAPQEEAGGCDDEEDCGGGAVVVNVPGAPTNTVQQVPVPVPAVASQQLPMEWAAEDAAEHAYNLAQWRVKILRAKMEQAKLRKQLMAVTMGATEGAEGPSEVGGDDEDEEADGDRGRESRRGELVAVKQSLLSLATETVGAIKQLKQQMLSLKKAVCCGNEEKAPVQSLEQVDEKSALKRAIARVKARKSKEVLAMKKKMDAQLNALLTKVTTLIKNKDA